MADDLELVCGFREWKVWNHWLFQLGNVLLLLTFIPMQGHSAELIIRSLASAGLFCISIWSWLILCLPDVFIWNMFFSIIHGYYINKLFWQLSPYTRFDDIGEDVYRTVFEPLKVSRQVFEKIYQRAKVMEMMTVKETLTTGAFKNPDSPGARIRLILKGSVVLLINEKTELTVRRMKVIESPFIYPGNETLLEVTPSPGTKVLVWSLKDLKHVLKSEEQRRAFEAFIVEDILVKIRTVLPSCQ